MSSSLFQHSRREFIGAAAKTFLGVTLLNNVAANSKAMAAGAGASTLKQPATAKNVIYLYMTGGMSHLDTFDPRASNQEVTGETEAIKTSADDVFVSSNLPLMAKQMHHVAVINSLSSNQGAHQQGNYFMHTSYTLRGTIRHPSMGAWLQKFQERGNPNLPGSIMIGNDSRHPGAGFFESKFSPLMINAPEQGLANSSLNPWFQSDQERFQSRLQAAKALDAGFDQKYNLKQVRAYTDMYDDAVSMMRSEDLKAFDLTQEKPELRRQYGEGSFGQGCLLARRLVEHGVRFVEVSMGNWDTHNANFVRVPELCEELDQGLSTLLQDLDAKGLLKDTLVVLATEFGRTPEINQNDGRDHHPSAFTCLLAGGGIKGGRSYGKKDEKGAQIEEHRVGIPDFNATIAYALGMPLDHVLYSPSKRPFTIADKGKPIVELFS